jgi:hypothetical protein
MDKDILDDLLKLPKDVRFGMIYGMSPTKLSKLNELEKHVALNRMALEGHFIDEVETPNAVQQWLKS